MNTRITLITPELRLRQGRAEDGPALYENLWRQEEAFRYLFARPRLTQEEGMQRTAAYADMHREVATEYFVCLRETDEAIGVAGVKELSSGVCTVTDVAIGPAFWGRGYGRQIVEALVDHAFAYMNAREMWYSCFAENEASRRLALCCGFRFDHEELAELMKNGRPVTLHVYRRNREA